MIVAVIQLKEDDLEYQTWKLENNMIVLDIFVSIANKMKII